MIKEELERRQLPEVLRMENGEQVCNEAAWELRRAEIAEILQHNFCGYEPPLKPRVEGRVMVEDVKNGCIIGGNLAVPSSWQMEIFSEDNRPAVSG